MDPGYLLLIHDEETQEFSDLRQAIYLLFLLKGRPFAFMVLLLFITQYGQTIISHALPLGRTNFTKSQLVQKKKQSEKPTYICRQK